MNTQNNPVAIHEKTESDSVLEECKNFKLHQTMEEVYAEVDRSVTPEKILADLKKEIVKDR